MTREVEITILIQFFHYYENSGRFRLNLLFSLNIPRIRDIILKAYFSDNPRFFQGVHLHPLHTPFPGYAPVRTLPVLCIIGQHFTR